MDEMRTIEIDAEVDDRLQSLADGMGVAKHEALAQVVREYAFPMIEEWTDEERAALDESIRRGLEDADAGRTVPWRPAIERLRAAIRDREAASVTQATDTSA